MAFHIAHYTIFAAPRGAFLWTALAERDGGIYAIIDLLFR